MRIPAILHIFLTNVLRRRQSAVRQWDRSIRHRACPNHPELEKIRPVVISGYIEEVQSTRSAPTVKQHLASLRMLFDWLVLGQVIPTNPASSVRGPKYVVKRGKTPVLKADEARRLLDSIKTDTIVGLRDPALIALMCYTFARVSAVVHMKVEDYFTQNGKRFWIRLHEKGGKRHEVPAHHNAEAYLDQYLDAARLSACVYTPSWRDNFFNKTGSERKVALNGDSFNFVECDLVARTIVELGRPR